MSRAARGLRVLRRGRHSAPPRLLTADFNYALPPERIAQEAAEPRDASKLLVRASSSSHHDLTFRQLPSLLRGTGAHIVLNESAVFAARLLARPDGADAPAVEWTLHKSYGLPHATRRIQDRFASTRALRRRAPPPVRPAANLLRPPRRPLGASESKEVEL